MGLLLTSLANVFATCVAVGALKRHGAISLHPEKIKNDGLRTVLVIAVDNGENVALRLENLWNDLSSKHN